MGITLNNTHFETEGVLHIQSSSNYASKTISNPHIKTLTNLSICNISKNKINAHILLDKNASDQT